MLKKSYLIISISLLGIIFLLFFYNQYAYSDNIDLDAIFELILNSEVHRSNIFEPLQFTNGLHFTEYECKCKECHHNWIQGEEGYPAKCGDCHKGKKLRGVLFTRSLKDAYHASCMGCHRERNVIEKTSAPIECMQCHTYRCKRHRKGKPYH